MTSPSIRLDGSDVHRAERLAEQTFFRFATSRGYYKNTPSSHRIGKLGEIAAQRWMQTNGVEAAALFSEPERQMEADIVCGEYRIEVKTWDNRWWSTWGRCVATGQLNALREKADCVLWLSIREVATESPTITIHGWSNIDDVASAPVRWTGPAGRQVKNHQLDEGALRGHVDLIERLRALK